VSKQGGVAPETSGLRRMISQEKRKLYLHIGMPKTGTTALQHFFKLNSNRLKEQGVIYPETGQFRDYSHHDITFSLSKNSYRKHLSKAQQVSFLNELDEEVKHYPKVLLSSECFPMLSQHSLFFEFLSQFDTKIICYLRRQDKFIESHYRQVIADPALPNLHYKIDRHIAKLHSTMTYAPFILNWDRLGSLIVRPYERGCFFGGNIFSDFSNIIDITIDKTFVFPQGDINPTDSNAFVDFMRILKLHKVLHSVLEIVSIDELRTLVVETIFSNNPSGFLSRKKRVDILKKFSDSNRKISQLYLGRDEMFSDLNVQKYGQAAYEGLSEAEVFCLLSKIVDKVAVDASLAREWEYSDSMSEKEVLQLFSQVLNIDRPIESSRNSIFSVTKKFLGRFSASWQGLSN
jgi:hypothetical protein